MFGFLERGSFQIEAGSDTGVKAPITTVAEPWCEKIQYQWPEVSPWDSLAFGFKSGDAEWMAFRAINDS